MHSPTTAMLQPTYSNRQARGRRQQKLSGDQRQTHEPTSGYSTHQLLCTFLRDFLTSNPRYLVVVGFRGCYKPEGQALFPEMSLKRSQTHGSTPQLFDQH